MAKNEYFEKRGNLTRKSIVENKRIGNLNDSKLKSKHINFNTRKNNKSNSGNLSKTNRKLPNVIKLEKEVLKSIIGQNMQVKQIITSIYRSKIFKSIKSNILVVGKSGTGKTATIVEIAKKLNIPYTIEDATKYTQEGYQGEDVQKMLHNLFNNANRNLQSAQEGILIIDEIDKKARKETFRERDVSGSEVLKSLLKIIEGTTIKINIGSRFNEEIINFNTKNLTVLFLGAFSGLEKIREKRLNAKKLGFHTHEVSIDKSKTRYTKKDLVEYGMPEEFVGRVDTIIEMNNLNINDLVSILKNSKLSIFKKYQNELKRLGVSLEFDEKLFELIAEESLELDTGARELSNTVNRIFENISYDIFSNKKNYTKCKLSLDIVEDNTKYKLS